MEVGNNNIINEDIDNMFDDIKNDDNNSLDQSSVTSTPPPEPTQNAKTISSFASDVGLDVSNSEKKEKLNVAGETVLNQKPPVVPEPENNQTKAPAKLPEDMFAVTEAPIPQEKPKPSVLQPKVSTAQAGGMEVVNSRAESKKIVLIGMLVAFLAILSYGSYWTYTSFFGSQNKNEVIDTTEVEKGIETSGASQPISANQSNVVEQSQSSSNLPADSDQDGLLDKEEAALGTDINNVDTDGDGLFDREEVRVYKTDPINPDTDGDGYMDGAEVDQNYNPLGPGKLYEINE